MMSKSPSHNIRDRAFILRSLQEKLCSPQNIDYTDVEEDELQQQEVDGLLLQLELHKKRALENKLMELQKKKDKMDEILSNIQQQHSARNLRPCIARNVQRTQRRYEAEGSAEEEVRYRQIPQRSNFMDTLSDVRNTNLAHKYRELEEAEIKLKQIEDLMKLIEQQELENDRQASNIAKNNRKTSNEDIRSDYHQYFPGSENTCVKEPRRVSSRAEASAVPSAANSDDPCSILSDNGRSADNFNFVTPCAFPNAGLNNGTKAEAMQTFKDRFIQSIKSHFDSVVSLLENQWNPHNSNSTNQQLLYMMMMQSQQFMQQQQLLLCLFQQQSSFNPVQNPSCMWTHGNVCYDCEARRLENGSSANSFTSNHSVPPTRNQAKSHTHEPVNPVTLNNQVPPGLKANNYWDNFKSNSRQNQLTSATCVTAVVKSNDNVATNNQIHNYNSHTLSVTTAVKNVADCSPSDAYPPAPVNAQSNGGFRRSKKAANTSQTHPAEAVEKVQNAPIKEPLNKTQPQTPDLTALYTMLEKFITSDETKEVKAVPSLKSSNLTARDVEEGAVGGDPVASPETNDRNDTLHASVIRHPVPLHMSPSTGAIRKRRNPEKEPDEASVDLCSGTETIRPLMAAEGRSSEVRSLPNGPTQSSSSSSSSLTPLQNSQSSAHLLLKRPPTTGATGRDDIDESNNSLTDDDLAEADQTTLEITGPEAESIPHNGASHPTAHLIVPVGDVLELSEIPEPTEDEEDEDNLSANNTSNGGIRLSGDGEQGL